MEETLNKILVKRLESETHCREANEIISIAATRITGRIIRSRNRIEHGLINHGEIRR